LINRSTSYSRAAKRILDEYPISVDSGSSVFKRSAWLDDQAVYVNRETGKTYKPHNQEEYSFVYTDGPRRFLVKGGEGSGKSVAGIVKSLERLRRGCSGIMGSPNFVHFRKSLWPEFQRWCPVNALIPKHRYRLEPGWEPTQPFRLVFLYNGRESTLLCGGFDSPGSWEGPNVNFAHFDEARHHPNPYMIKVIDGRCRIPGPNGEPSQWWITTTPRKSRLNLSPDNDQYHWLYMMFGPWTDKIKEDPFAAFKRDSKVITLKLSENASNLDVGYADSRRESLTASEESVLVNAEWVDEESLERFLPSILLWDSCFDDLPPLTSRDPLVLALDAATGRQSGASDCFTIAGISPHPKDKQRYALRVHEDWSASSGHEIDFVGTDDYPGPETRLRQIFRDFNVLCVCYDPHQLISTAQRLEMEEGIWFDKFGQVSKRLDADRAFLEDIKQKIIAHDGDATVRAHIDNADRKVDEFGSKFRIVKGRGRVDYAVSISMALFQAKELAL